MHIQDIPPELLCSILGHTDIVTTIRCQQINTTFKATIDSTPFLQYRIALCRHGMEDVTHESPNVSYTDLVTRLEQYVSDRDNFRWTSEYVVEKPDHNLWQLQQGFFGFYNEQTKVFSFHRIPSKARGITSKEWTVPFEPDAGRTFLSFGIDPSQDLVLVVTVPNGWADEALLMVQAIQFGLSGENDDIPPLDTTLRHVLGDVDDRRFCDSSVVFAVLGNHISLYLNPGEINTDLFLVANWKSGETLLVVYDMPCTGILLSPTHAAYIWSYGNWHEDENAHEGLVVVDLRTLSHTLLRFPLDEYKGNIDVWSQCYIAYGPSPPHGPLNRATEWRQKQNQLMVLTIELEGSEEKWIFVCDISHILDVLSEEGEKSTKPPPPRRRLVDQADDSIIGNHISWDTWGKDTRKITRIHDRMECSYRSSCIDGSRIIAEVDLDPAEVPTSWAILEFNRGRVSENHCIRRAIPTRHLGTTFLPDLSHSLWNTGTCSFIPCEDGLVFRATRDYGVSTQKWIILTV